MNFETFFVNAVKLATSASVSNLPVLELTKKDMGELSGYLEDNGIGYTQENEQEIRFTLNSLNFTAIENDKSEDVGLDGKVIEPAKYEAILNEEQQAEVDRNTDTFNAAAPDAPLAQDKQEAVDIREEASAQALAGNTAEKIEEERAATAKPQTKQAAIKEATTDKKAPKKGK
jgi:hypothetical protein